MVVATRSRTRRLLGSDPSSESAESNKKRRSAKSAAEGKAGSDGRGNNSSRKTRRTEDSVKERGTASKSSDRYIAQGASESERTGTTVAIRTDKKGVKNLSVLFSLRDDDEELCRAKLVARPSKRNRSPYVADVWLESEEREAIAHVPNLDMGGKCVPGVAMLLKPARTAGGVKVGEDAVSAKYGTPKCEFISQLLYVDESHLHRSYYPPAWVGAHPSLGERVAEAWFRRDDALGERIPPVSKIQRQVNDPYGSVKMRSDFLLTHIDGSKRLVEVKTVVDTDYSSSALPATHGDKKSSIKCLFSSDKKPYKRTAIFPWGNSKQKGPDGEAVVSSRAIHHVRELTNIVNRVRSNDEKVSATILFVVIRGDAESFRPNVEACPSFCRYLQEARDAGVQILAKRVTWGMGDDIGTCYYDGNTMLPLDWPSTAQVQK